MKVAGSRGYVVFMALLVLLLPLAACTPAAPAPSPAAAAQPTPGIVLTIAAGPAGQEQLSRWIARYERARPNTRVQVQLASSDRAQGLLASGAVDLALLDEQPAELYRGVLTATRVAWEPLAIVVHPENPIRDISTPALVELLRGHIADWGALGGAGGAVQIYTLPATSGTAQSLVGESLSGADLSPQALVVATPASLIEAVSADPGGIGVIPADAAAASMVISVDGRLPRDPSYPWRSPLFLVHGEHPAVAALEFIRMIAPAGVP